jgi:hypothetical protein
LCLSVIRQMSVTPTDSLINLYTRIKSYKIQLQKTERQTAFIAFRGNISIEGRGKESTKRWNWTSTHCLHLQQCPIRIHQGRGSSAKSISIGKQYLANKTSTCTHICNAVNK